MRRSSLTGTSSLFASVSRASSSSVAKATPRVAAIRDTYPRAILWKALAIESERDLERADEYRAVDALLLEAGERGKRIAVPAESLAALAARRPIVLAGGLTPENVGDTVREVRPWAVDVSSGVESAPAQKDRARVKAFILRAREAAVASRA